MKRTIKSLLLAVLVVCTVCVLTVMASAAVTEGQVDGDSSNANDLVWKIEGTTLTIKGTSTTIVWKDGATAGSSSQTMIPWVENNAANTTIKNVVIDAPITELPKAIFARHRNLKSVTLPETCKIFRNSVFEGDWSLAEIKIGDESPANVINLSKITDVGSNAFKGAVTSGATLWMPDGNVYLRFNYGFGISSATEYNFVVYPDSKAETDLKSWEGGSNVYGKFNISYYDESDGPIVPGKTAITIPTEDTTVYTYNGNEQTYKITENDAYTVTGNKQTAANEKGYTVTVELKDTANYQWSDGTVEAKNYTFVINKATITITANDKVAKVGDAIPALGDSDYSVSGLVSGEALKTNPTISYEVNPDMNKAGTTQIIVAGAEAPDGGNYNDIVYNNGTLTIAKDADEYEWLWYYLMILNSQKVDITATASAGGKIDPIGVSNAQYSKSVTYTITPDDGYAIKSVLVDGNDVGAVSTYTFKNVTKKHTIHVIFESVNPYTDVKTNDWFYEDVLFVTEAELMEGTGNGKFSPEIITDRAMLVTVLWRMEGSPVVDSTVDFSDVQDGLWYSDAINWASANGIVNGYGDGKFGPTDEITREQIAAILNRYATYKKLTDGTTLPMIAQYKYNEWAENNVSWAENNGLLEGLGVDLSDMTAKASRAELAAYLTRFMKNIVK